MIMSGLDLQQVVGFSIIYNTVDSQVELEREIFSTIADNHKNKCHFKCFTYTIFFFLVVCWRVEEFGVDDLYSLTKDIQYF